MFFYSYYGKSHFRKGISSCQVGLGAQFQTKELKFADASGMRTMRAHSVCPLLSDRRDERWGEHLRGQNKCPKSTTGGVVPMEQCQKTCLCILGSKEKKVNPSRPPVKRFRWSYFSVDLIQLSVQIILRTLWRLYHVKLLQQEFICSLMNEKPGDSWLVERAGTGPLTKKLETSCSIHQIKVHPCFWHGMPTLPFLLWPLSAGVRRPRLLHHVHGQSKAKLQEEQLRNQTHGSTIIFLQFMWFYVSLCLSAWKTLTNVALLATRGRI